MINGRFMIEIQYRKHGMNTEPRREECKFKVSQVDEPWHEPVHRREEREKKFEDCSTASL